MGYTVLPKGSILYIEALDPLAMTIGSTTFTYPNASSSTNAGGQNYTTAAATKNILLPADKSILKFRRVTEHNRSEFNNRTLRVEQSQRMANGCCR
jgi:hypothetical protein